VVIEPRVRDDTAIAGQGTMNNLTLGSEDVVYYETIGGGPGARLDPAGQARCTWR
jgi:N-methylhydantoinase B/oxoprolinase/acetone carboxylase alpha subunit